jgi:hypothetical protein
MGEWMDVLLVGWTVGRTDGLMCDGLVYRWMGDGLMNICLVG